jgi:hypothetical protein
VTTCMHVQIFISRGWSCAAQFFLLLLDLFLLYDSVHVCYMNLCYLNASEIAEVCYNGNIYIVHVYRYALLCLVLLVPFAVSFLFVLEISK